MIASHESKVRTFELTDGCVIYIYKHGFGWIRSDGSDGSAQSDE